MDKIPPTGLGKKIFNAACGNNYSDLMLLILDWKNNKVLHYEQIPIKYTNHYNHNRL